MEEIEDLDVTLNESILESIRGKKTKSTNVRTRPAYAVCGVTLYHAPRAGCPMSMCVKLACMEARAVWATGRFHRASSFRRLTRGA
jgi:hypothetical protein